jgi:hypothetical protein
MLNKFIEDYQTAADNKEFYDRCQKFYKGSNAEPSALMEHMSLHYVPKPIKRIMFLKMEWMNKFFNWWLDYRKINVLTLAMIVAIIWLVNQAW